MKTEEEIESIKRNIISIYDKVEGFTEKAVFKNTINYLNSQIILLSKRIEVLENDVTILKRG